MNKRLANKTTLITGGGSWIGKEIATVYAREGAQVFILGRDEKKLEQTISEIKKAGGTAAIAARMSAMRVRCRRLLRKR